MAKLYQEVVGNWKISYIFICHSGMYSDYTAGLKSKCIKYVWKTKIHQKEKHFFIFKSVKMSKDYT